MKFVFFFIISALFISVLSFSVSASCITSSDDYASEVLLNSKDVSFNLNLLDNAKNVLIKDNRYILQSEYSSSLAMILEKQPGLGDLSGLSVRLQIPVKAEEKTYPYLKFVFTSFKSRINVSGDNYNGWEISCLQGEPIPECEFSKDKTTLYVNFVLNKYEITFETKEDLGICSSCDGKCISGGGNGRCINKQLETSVEDILKYSGLANRFDDLLMDYRVISIGSISTVNIFPQFEGKIEWKEAMKEGLESLKERNIIMITAKDILSIANLAKQGAAGQNERIVYGQDKLGSKNWFYYKDTIFPPLTKSKNCAEFNLSDIPPGKFGFSEEILLSPYYLVPAVITISLIILFVFLIVLARVVEGNGKKKNKPENL